MKSKAQRMDDGLPIVGPEVDLSQTPAINHKRTLAFLNHFITHTVRFLNRFSCVCEEKLADMQRRIQRLEITLSILEAKLSSIPGLDKIAPIDTTPPPAAQTTSNETTQQTPAQQQTPQANNGPKETDDTIPEPAAVEPEKPKMTVSKDPRYMKFFKMVNFGVPSGAVKAKMAAEGLNPDLLDTPDAPMDGSPPPPQQQSDSSDEVSDEESDSDASSFTDSD